MPEMEPAPTDLDWLQAAPINRPSGWLRRTQDPHVCEPPSPGPQTSAGRPAPHDAGDGDVWRCPCGLLWMVAADRLTGRRCWEHPPLSLRWLHVLGLWPR